MLLNIFKANFKKIKQLLISKSDLKVKIKNKTINSSFI